MAILQVSQAKLEGILLDKKSRRKKQESVSEAPDFELQNPVLRCLWCRNSYPADFPLSARGPVSWQPRLLRTSRAPSPTRTGSSSTDPSWVSQGLLLPSWGSRSGSPLCTSLLLPSCSSLPLATQPPSQKFFSADVSPGVVFAEVCVYHFSVWVSVIRIAELMKTATFLNVIVLLSVIWHLRFCTFWFTRQRCHPWEEASLSTLHQNEPVGLKSSFCLLWVYTCCTNFSAPLKAFFICFFPKINVLKEMKIWESQDVHLDYINCISFEGSLCVSLQLLSIVRYWTR